MKYMKPRVVASIDSPGGNIQFNPLFNFWVWIGGNAKKYDRNGKLDILELITRGN